MNRVLKASAIVMAALTVSITAGENKDEKLAVQPAASYPNKQTSEGVTIAADVYETGDKVKAAFGKHNPYDYGVLPVLVVIANDSSQAINVSRMKVEYIAPGGERVVATPARDLPYLSGPRRPGVAPSPVPGIPGVSRGKKNPLSDWQITGRAFSAEMIPPHESASGFFYFQTGHRSDSKVYLSGITVPATHKELFYFEIPLAPVQ